MDSIDKEIKEIYIQNSHFRNKKYFALYLGISISIDLIIFLISVITASFFMKMLFDVVSGISMTFFFLWFIHNIRKESE
ncbi:MULTISPECIES: hypothetical protein [Acidiplasma]|jgi:hypothetical protein|uniref:Uncharacterized protein n=2 Tax=Acidiplasma TaxID=507753 RepID=A0A0N8VKX8_9ARCH|nr:MULTISPECIES: hypothetical protein [Acidiplasma]KJE49226.1 hypothetical protein TZ01_03935 [Acidiplasma sp. MBA-1]KPV46959.1 hypothetical protein SE19_03180 [Acidiplasma aeolicum]KQB33934.1 hypothetical protein AOG54_06110 [Acidiplasma aeolicum]KQB34964.1 hypothetical protein AOG55_08535 [Acidiplasma cupricumulans]WMT54808.1 MAG: hypothetical protein RE470_07810 [Acidiplasma sp.]